MITANLLFDRLEDLHKRRKALKKAKLSKKDKIIAEIIIMGKISEINNLIKHC